MKSTLSPRSFAHSLPRYEPIAELLMAARRLTLATCPFCRGNADVTAGVGGRCGQPDQNQSLAGNHHRGQYVFARVACVECGAERMATQRMASPNYARSAIMRAIRLWNTRSRRARRLMGQAPRQDPIRQPDFVEPLWRMRVTSRLRALSRYLKMDPETQMALVDHGMLELLQDSPSFNTTPINLP